MFTVPPAIQAQRLSTCRVCKWYNKKFGTCGTPVVGSNEYDDDEIDELNTKTHYRKKIKLCGCFMNVKTKLTFASCPAEKWGSFRLNKEEISELQKFLRGLSKSGQVDEKQARQLWEWKSKLTGRRENYTLCPGCVRDLINVLNRELKTANNETSE